MSSKGELTLWLDDERTGDPARWRQLSARQPCHCRYGNLSDQLTRVLWVYT